MNSQEYYDQIKGWFDNDIINHKMKIMQDNGLFRHIRFAVPGTSIQYFNLTTFPHHLCISGDMGTFVFSRVEDMFRFFRNDRMVINPSYWGEKLQSISTNGGYKKFNIDEFKESVEQWFVEFRDCLDDGELADKVWADIKYSVLTDNDDGDGWVAMRGAIDYVYDDYENDIKIENIFQDFWEQSCTRYSINYIWCLHAIVYGINKYDEFKGK